jgi:hypothetical protein
MTQGRYQLSPSILIAVILLGPPPLSRQPVKAGERGDCVVFDEVPNETTAKKQHGLLQDYSLYAVHPFRLSFSPL